MIGTQAGAERAFDGELDLLAVGSTRMAFIDNDVVYKVEIEHNSNVNVDEYEKMTSIKELPTGVFFPNVSLYVVGRHTVIAMEYIAGQAVAECYCIDAIEEHTDDCMPDSVWQAVNGVLDDLSGFNTIVNDAGIYIIDMG